MQLSPEFYRYVAECYFAQPSLRNTLYLKSFLEIYIINQHSKGSEKSALIKKQFNFKLSISQAYLTMELCIHETPINTAQ